jgi:hypothetical protein
VHLCGHLCMRLWMRRCAPSLNSLVWFLIPPHGRYALS